MRRAWLLRRSSSQPAVVSSLLVLAWLLLVGCASTQLEVGPNDPANPAAKSEPVPLVGQALAPDFDPQATGSVSPGADSHPGHEHHQQEPRGAQRPSTPHAAQDHEGSSPQALRAANAHPEHAPPDAKGNDSRDAVQRWTCTMHPQVLEPKPGKCPICGMKLVPVPAKAAPGGAP
jgi:Heavy metal binding domain